jgi:1,4-dihydroxy-2-naphthoate polyprenyltransferase
MTPSVNESLSLVPGGDRGSESRGEPRGEPRSLKAWLRLPRFQYLPLTVNLVSLGTAIGAYDGFFRWGRFLLALVGSMLVHMTVNVINDYYDYIHGIDLNTRRTPFSGGSGVLPAELLKPKQAFWFGTFCLSIATGIGAYFVLTRGWLLFPLLLVAGFSAYFYNVCLARWMIGELFAGLNFGPIMVLGAYFIQTGTYSTEALVASIAPGILTANLLFLNEFPDRDADQQGGRRHLVIALGKGNARYLFGGLVLASYLCIVIGVLTKMMPGWTLLGLLTAGVAWKAIRGAMTDYDDTVKLVPTLGANVITILGTQALVAVGYVVATLTA